MSARLLAAVRVLAVLLPAGLLGCAPPGVAPPGVAQSSKERLLEDFRRVALGAEVASAETDGIWRWERGLVYTVSNRAGPALSALVERQFALIRRLTGLAIRPAGVGEAAAFVVDVLSEAELRARAARIRAKPSGARGFRERLLLDFADRSRVRCIFHVHGDSGRRIVSAAVFINTTRSGDRDLRECVAEEITQAMGLLNDDDRVRSSIFNDTARQTALTPHDETLLKLLYDPRLDTRMSGEEVLRAAAAVLEEMRL